MNNIETYNSKERFPVGDRGVVLLEYPTLPKRFAICLYDQSNPDELLGRVSETSEQAAYRIYLERCDTPVDQLEKKTGIQFPLPASCMAVLTSTGDLVNIRRGMTGYYPSDWNVPGDRKWNEETAAFNNAQYELTKAQCAAMVCGSMFGWDVPGADPAMYDENDLFRSTTHLLDARMEEFDCVELFDHPALFHNCRIDPATVPEGIYRYEVREDGENGYACEIAMDKANPSARKYIAQQADLLGAIRLPNNAFRANAGTDVAADILFLQKRDHPIEIDEDWLHIGKSELGYPINEYYLKNPDMVLGELTEESTRFGMGQTVKPIEDANLSEQLRDAIVNIHSEIVALEQEDELEGTAKATLPADLDVRNFSFTLLNCQVKCNEV